MSHYPPERTQYLNQFSNLFSEQFSNEPRIKTELFCSYCASKLDKDDKTCSRCGAPTKDSYYDEIGSVCVFTEHLRTDNLGFSQLSRVPIGEVNVIYEKIEDGAQTVKDDCKKIKCRPNRMIKAIYRCNTL